MNNEYGAQIEENNNDNHYNDKPNNYPSNNNIDEYPIYPNNHFNSEGFDTIEPKGNIMTSSLDFNLNLNDDNYLNNNKENNGNLIQKLCNKNTKYRELIKLIDQPSPNGNNNNNNDETALNLINLFQNDKQKAKGLQVKMTKSKFSFLYNEINSMCSASFKPPNSTNRIMTPTNQLSHFNYNLCKDYNSNNQIIIKQSPMYTTMNKLKTLEIDTENAPIKLKRNLSLKNGLVSPFHSRNIKERIQQEQKGIIKNSSSFSSFMKKKSFIPLFSNDYYENELNKFSTRLYDNKSNKNNVEMLMKKPNYFYNHAFMKKYEKMMGNNRTIFSKIK